MTDFNDKGIVKVESNHTCSAVISLDSALMKDEHYYPQVFLKECKYIQKKVVRCIMSLISQIKNRLKHLVNVFWECIFWGSNFKNAFFL